MQSSNVEAHAKRYLRVSKEWSKILYQWTIFLSVNLMRCLMNNYRLITMPSTSRFLQLWAANSIWTGKAQTTMMVNKLFLFVCLWCRINSGYLYKHNTWSRLPICLPFENKLPQILFIERKQQASPITFHPVVRIPLVVPHAMTNPTSTSTPTKRGHGDVSSNSESHTNIVTNNNSEPVYLTRKIPQMKRLRGKSAARKRCSHATSARSPWSMETNRPCSCR